MPVPPFRYQEPFPLAKDVTAYRLLTKDFIATGAFAGREILKVDPEALACIAHQAMRDCSFLLREKHLDLVAAILDDPQASENDRYVALTLLRNAEISAEGILPFCQDTGTATVIAKKGQQVWTGANDAEYLSRGSTRHTPRRIFVTRKRFPWTCIRRSIRAPTCRRRSISTQPKARATSSSSSRRAEARPTRHFSTRKPRRC